MASYSKKDTSSQEAILPKDSDTIYNIKIDRDTQKFYVDDEDLKQTLGYFTEFNFRVLESYDKFVSYNTMYEVTNETTLFQNLKDSKDALGGTHCGREVYKNNTQKMSEEQKRINDNKAKWYKLIFGIATVKGLPPFAADFRLSGKPKWDSTQIINKIEEEKKEKSRAELRIKAFEEVEYDWPSLEITADFTKTLPATGLEPFYDLIHSYVKDHNSKILQKAANGGVAPAKKQQKQWKKY